MHELAQLLELLYSAHERVSSLQAEFREWSHPCPNYELLVDKDDLRQRLRWRGAGPWPQETEKTRRMWFVSPGYLRVEILHNHALERLGVRDRSNWWRWDEIDGATVGEAESGQGRLLLPPLLDPPLLDPVRLIPALRLEPAGVGIRAGREVRLARGWPREPQPSRGALSFEFEFDSEHGTILRRAASEDGRSFQATEALQVCYGGKIESKRFVFTPPDGRPARRLEPLGATTNGAGPRGTGARNMAANGLALPLAANGRLAGTIWLTGLPAAGKTTLAYTVRDLLARHGDPVCVLDGDGLRRGLSSDLGLTPADRGEQARRAAQVAALISSGGVVAVVALVSPFMEDRQRARQIHDELGLPFFEVWVDTPLAVCEQRDPKGLYARARSGQLRDLTGVDAPYEPPEAPELCVSGYDEDPLTVAVRIVDLLAASVIA